MVKYHYVYALTDPRKLGAPFYIGKGSGNRKVQHFHSVPKEMQGNEGSDKHKIIHDIKAAGLEPSAIVLSHHADEEAALDAERAMIKSVGLKNLVNKSIGGEGVKANKAKGKQALTIKQEAFCYEMVRGTNPSASDAYRVAYNPKTATKKTINEMAAVLMKNPKIAARIEELRAPVVEKLQYDLEWCLGRQDDAVKLAEVTGNASAMSGAVREIGRLVDVYPSDKSEVTIKADDLVERLQRGRARAAEEAG